jgi:hypothetical protein
MGVERVSLHCVISGHIGKGTTNPCRRQTEQDDQHRFCSWGTRDNSATDQRAKIVGTTFFSSYQRRHATSGNKPPQDVSAMKRREYDGST